MWAWIQAHIAVIVICAVLAAVLVLAVVSVVRDKKRGKCSCGANCSQCAMGEHCHGQGSGTCHCNDGKKAE